MRIQKLHHKIFAFSCLFTFVCPSATLAGKVRYPDLGEHAPLLSNPLARSLSEMPDVLASSHNSANRAVASTSSDENLLNGSGLYPDLEKASNVSESPLDLEGGKKAQPTQHRGWCNRWGESIVPGCGVPIGCAIIVYASYKISLFFSPGFWHPPCDSQFLALPSCVNVCEGITLFTPYRKEYPYLAARHVNASQGPLSPYTLTQRWCSRVDDILAYEQDPYPYKARDDYMKHRWSSECYNHEDVVYRICLEEPLLDGLLESPQSLEKLGAKSVDDPSFDDMPPLVEMNRDTNNI